MFHLPTLQPCEGVPLWIMTEDDLTQALVLWWPSGTAWVVHGPSDVSTDSTESSRTPDNHLDAA